MGTELVKTDFTPQLDQGRALVTKAGDLLAAQLISGLTRLEADAHDVKSVFERFPAEVEEKTLERAADFKKAISRSIKAAEDTRKGLTRPLDDLKNIIMDLFRVNTEALQVFERKVQERLDAYYAKVDAARKAADAAAATGGTVTAEQAQALVAPLKATSEYGTGVSSRRRVSGELADIKRFLRWLVKEGTDEEIAQVKVPKSLLNTLAMEADEAGLAPSEFETSSGVKMVVENKALIR